MRRQAEWTNAEHPVSTADGKHDGSYQFDEEMLRASYKGYTKVTQLSGAVPNVLARIMRGELVRETLSDA